MDLSFAIGTIQGIRVKGKQVHAQPQKCTAISEVSLQIIVNAALSHTCKRETIFNF